MRKPCDCKNCKFTRINGGYMPCIKLAKLSGKANPPKGE